MSFSTITLGLLLRPDEMPEVAPEEDARLMDAHLAHLASLADEGVLYAAGPVTEQDDPALRGVVLLSTPVEDARALLEEDPRVRAGLLEVMVGRWTYPRGTVRYDAGDFPRSVAEATARRGG